MSIKGTVSKRAEPKKKENQTKTDHEEQKADQGHAKPFGGSIGESIVEQPSGSNPKRGYFSKGKNWVSLLTLLFVGAYTVITIFILCNSQEQVQISRMNFRMDQRPYLLIEDIKGKTLDFKRGEKASWGIQYINYGKSPTVKGTANASVWVGKTAAAKMNDFFRKLPTAAPPDLTAFIVPPNASAGVGQNGFHYTTLFSETAITEDDSAFMRANDGGVIMAGRTWYTDIFGDSHSSDFCRYTLMSGAIADCPDHNEIR